MPAPQLAELRTRQAEVLKVQGASAVSGAARQLLFMETMKNPHKKSSMSWRGADYTKVPQGAPAAT